MAEGPAESLEISTRHVLWAGPSILRCHSPERWTKQGFRLYLFDEVWTEFKKLIDKVDKAYQELA